MFQNSKLNIPLSAEIFNSSEIIDQNRALSQVQIDAFKLCNPNLIVNTPLAKNVKVMLLSHSGNKKSLYAGVATVKADKKSEIKKIDDDHNIYEFVKCEVKDITQLNSLSNFEKTTSNYVKYIKPAISMLNISEEMQISETANEKNLAADQTKPKAPTNKKKSDRADVSNEDENAAVTHLIVCTDENFEFLALQAALKRLLPGLESISQDFSTHN